MIAERNQPWQRPGRARFTLVWRHTSIPLTGLVATKDFHCVVPFKSILSALPGGDFMGVASYREDIVERFHESAEPPRAHARAAEPSYPCPYCSDRFPRERALVDHLGQHGGDRPVLLLHGLEPGRRDFVRYRPRVSSIRVVNCTMARVRIDGAPEVELLPTDLPALLTRYADAIFDLELLHGFEPRAEPIVQRYRVTISAPEQRVLDGVDRAFRQYLATGSLHVAQVSAFLADARCGGVTKDYTDALAAYVLGVLEKDQAPNTGVTLPPAEAAKHYGDALDRLRGYRRPLATVVCALIRFVKNDFSDVCRSGVRRLDLAREMLCTLAGNDLELSGEEEETGIGRMVALCPIDQGIDRVLDLAERMQRLTHWGRQTSEECRQAADAGTLDVADRVKILALWAATALRLSAVQDAKAPLRRLRNTYPFGTWADMQLDRIKREIR